MAIAFAPIDPVSAVIGGAGLVASAIGGRQARRERAAARSAALLALAPRGEELEIRNQFLAEGRRGLAGALPANLETLARRQEAISIADAARLGEMRRNALSSRLAATGLLGSGAGAAALGRFEAAEGRAADALALAREREIFSASQAERARGLGILQNLLGELGAERRARAGVEAGFQADAGGALGAAGGDLFRAAIENILTEQAEEVARQRLAGASPAATTVPTAKPKAALAAPDLAAAFPSAAVPRRQRRARPSPFGGENLSSLVGF